MTEHKTFPGKTYVVTSKAGCDITDASGELEETCEPGKQKVINAPSDILYTSAPAVVRETFNLAPAKMMVLGLLGGGVSFALPKGYIAAEFLTTDDTFITVPLSLKTNADSIRIETLHSAIKNTQPMHAEGVDRFAMGQWKPDYYMVDINGGVTAPGNLTAGSYYEFWLEVHPTGFEFGSSFPNEKSVEKATSISVTEYNLFARNSSLVNTCWSGKKKYWKAWKNGELLFDLIPTITPMGEPAFYNKVDGAVYGNSYTGTLTVGMTLAQARKLANLPAGGGTLTVSLPSNWQEDEGVVTALATAESNGWVLTYQTYEADASTASTFALRRIFVRKTQNENGQYVAADGSRWHVEWCAGMIGAEPTDHGYEPFRSVDAAVAYWEFVPWVDPEQE